jgi:hypothetical protein
MLEVTNRLHIQLGKLMNQPYTFRGTGHLMTKKVFQIRKCVTLLAINVENEVTDGMIPPTSLKRLVLR